MLGFACRSKYDRGDSFSFDFEPNGIILVPNQKENCHQDHISFNLKANKNLFFRLSGNYESCLKSEPYAYVLRMHVGLYTSGRKMNSFHHHDMTRHGNEKWTYIYINIYIPVY